MAGGWIILPSFAVRYVVCAMLCNVTPKEHLGLPHCDVVKDSVIAGALCRSLDSGFAQRCAPRNDDIERCL